MTQSPWGTGGSNWNSLGDFGQSVGNMYGAWSKGQFDQASADDQNRYNMQMWQFENRENKRQWEHLKEGVRISRENEQEERHWRNRTAKNDWKHSMAIRDYEYNMQMRAYNKSEETYKQQLNFNNMAADVAMESENRFLEEQFIDAAFKNQDIVVQQLQEEGKAQLLQSGKSAGKAVQAVIAQAGRNQAILAESILSAKKQYSVNIKKIQTDKYGADIQAEANRMLKPEIAPALPKPILLPKMKIQMPLMPHKTPKPPKVRVQSQTGNMIGAGINAAISLASLFSDERLKENIVKVGQSESGINIYEFNYINETQRYQGVLAQELLDTNPDAVSIGEDGYYRVDYSLIDVNMQPV